MTAVTHPHAVLLQQVQQEFAKIFSQSSQGVYIYLDDAHWISNDRLATFLGYASAEELLKVSGGFSFLEALVATDSQKAVVEAYTNAAKAHAASSISVVWKKKGGGTMDTRTIFVPISFGGTVLVMHFITPV